MVNGRTKGDAGRRTSILVSGDLGVGYRIAGIAFLLALLSHSAGSNAVEVCIGEDRKELSNGDGWPLVRNTGEDVPAEVYGRERGRGDNDTLRLTEGEKDVRVRPCRVDLAGSKRSVREDDLDGFNGDCGVRGGECI